MGGLSRPRLEANYAQRCRSGSFLTELRIVEMLPGTQNLDHRLVKTKRSFRVKLHLDLILHIPACLEGHSSMDWDVEQIGARYACAGVRR